MHKHLQSFTSYVEQHLRYLRKTNESRNLFLVVTPLNGTDLGLSHPGILPTRDTKHPAPMFLDIYIDIYRDMHVYSHIYIHMHMYIYIYLFISRTCSGASACMDLFSKRKRGGEGGEGG